MGIIQSSDIAQEVIENLLRDINDIEVTLMILDVSHLSSQQTFKH